MKTNRKKKMKEKNNCPHCKSTKLEYYPDVDGASWVRHIYVQTKNGWEIKVFADEDKDVSTIQTGKIFQEDMMPYMYCISCTAEFHGRDLA
jgi:hypothetical protein